jgi:hypothetical protein
MTKRVIKTGIGTYQDAKTGREGTFGYQGQEVDVHADDLERFDALNVQPGVAEDWEPQARDFTTVNASGQTLVSPAAGDETSGTGSGLATVVETDDDGNPVDDSTAEDDQNDAEAPRKRAAARKSTSRRR